MKLSQLLKKLICKIRRHKTHYGQYDFMHTDGKILVTIPSHVQCKRCRKLLQREIEPFEWPFIASGRAVIEDIIK